MDLARSCWVYDMEATIKHPCSHFSGGWQIGMRWPQTTTNLQTQVSQQLGVNRQTTRCIQYACENDKLTKKSAYSAHTADLLTFSTLRRKPRMCMRWLADLDEGMLASNRVCTCKERDASNKRVRMASIERKVNKQKLHVLQSYLSFSVCHTTLAVPKLFLLYFILLVRLNTSILGTQCRRQPPFTCVAKQGPSCHIHNTQTLVLCLRRP